MVSDSLQLRLQQHFRQELALSHGLLHHIVELALVVQLVPKGHEIADHFADLLI